jgi:integrase
VGRSYLFVDLFLAYLERNNYSENTVKAYEHALQSVKNLDYQNITTVDLMKILSRSRSIKTVASHQSAIKKFFRWLYVTERITHNPAESLGSVKTKPSTGPQPIPEGDYKAIMKEIDMLPLIPRVLFQLIAETNINIHQALALNVEDIGDSYIEAGREIFFFNPRSELGELLRKLCTQQKHGPLFTNKKKERGPYLWAYHWWGKIMKKLNMSYNMKQLGRSKL